jgi:hypothetical protein
MNHLIHQLKIKFIATVNAGLKQLNKKYNSVTRLQKPKSELGKIAVVLVVVTPVLAFIMTMVFAILALLIIKN